MEKCNGWNSYETWLFVVWADSDYYTSKHYVERSMYWANQYKDDITEAKYQFSKELENDMYNSYCDEIPLTGLIADLLRAAIQKIDFYEIADKWIDDENW